jgi:hypothetical protein
MTIWEMRGQNSHDSLIKDWELEPTCEGKGLAILTEGSKHAERYAPGTVPLTVSADWPPKIEEAVIESMEKAVCQIEEVAGLSEALPKPAEKEQGVQHARKACLLEVFYSYSHKDEDLRIELEKHLAILKRDGDIAGRHFREITPGREVEGVIDEHINKASIILLLISSDFLSSDYYYRTEMKRAMERHKEGRARVIPVILRAVYWKGAPFANLQALPTGAEPVTSWHNIDEAFEVVATGIRRAVEELRESRGDG